MKHRSKGFVNHGFPWDCWNCCCCVCTGRYCPYHKYDKGVYRYRCEAVCHENNRIVKALDCDYFENRHTSARRFKIRRRFHREDSIISRLDRIMKTLDVPEVPKPVSIDDEAKRLVDTYNKKNGAG